MPSSHSNILERLPSAVAAPPLLYQPGFDKVDQTASLPANTTFPSPRWTKAVNDAQKRRRPQCIAHRGYKTKFPENTMSSFKGAVEAGTHAIETDVHLTKDEVVVLSHDASLFRCFGRDQKIIDHTWDEIKEYRTIAEPHVGMPRLKDLLEYLAQPGLEEIWVLLDIKLDNKADDIMRLIGKTIEEVQPSSNREWKDRIVLGAWGAMFLPMAAKYLPGFAVTHIAFALPYAHSFFEVPNVSFNTIFSALVAPGGGRFLRRARQEKRPTYSWTVNDKNKMEWCIRRQLDGICTDDVGLFLQTCKEFDDEKPEPLLPLTLKQYWDAFRILLWITFGFWFFRRKFALSPPSKSLIQKEAGS